LSHLVFEISDSGVGMPADQLQRIFEPFHRIENAERRAEGTGLGLTITRRLVEAMHGSIFVASEPGRGTTFRVELEMPVASCVEETRERGRSIIGYAGPRRSILVADDDEVNRALVADFLGGLGFDVRRAADGATALEQLRREPADLLITDLVMPIVDGMELIRALRATDGRNARRILTVSASASDYTSQEALEAGSDAFLPKPLRLASLLDRIAELLDLQWQYGEVDAQVEREPAPPVDFCLERALAQELYHLAMLGDITGLIDRATQCLASDPGAAAFCGELQALANQYDTGAIRRMLNAHGA
jgi:CheY-like chemotaxis protein